MRLNRRVPSGTHGGVRGRGLLSPSYSIVLLGFLTLEDRLIIDRLLINP